MVSSRVTWIKPYVSVPRLGQYWSHLIYRREGGELRKVRERLGSLGAKPCPQHLTRDFSSSRVIMTTVADRCSHTIRQKSPKVSGRGPCVAM